MHGVAALVSAAVVAAVLAVAQDCNCPAVGGICTGITCNSSYPCCGVNSLNPSCLLPGNQCCTWSWSATQCSDAESCCGDLGGERGGYPHAFCCGAGSSCCPTSKGGYSSCCGPKQICCGVYDTFCCDWETEVCGPDVYGVCVPKWPFTRSPQSGPGQLLWMAYLNLSETWNSHAPLIVNSSFVVAAGAQGTALVRLSDGAITFILPQAEEAPTIAAGRVIITPVTGVLMSYDLHSGTQSWTTNFASESVGLVGYEHYLLAVSNTPSTLSVFDARNGSQLYTIPWDPYTYPVLKPVVSPHGTAAFVFVNAFIIFRVATGAILVNASTNCSNPPPPLLAGSTFVSCNLVAYSARDGKELWAAVTPASLISIAATNRAIVGGTKDHLYFLDRSTGQLIKKLPIGGPNVPFALTAVGDDVLFASTNLTAYNGTTGELRWNYAPSQYGFQSSGVLHRGYVYLPASSDVYPAAIVAVDPTIGGMVGSWNAGGAVSSPVFVGDRVLYMSADGYLYCGTAM